MAQTYTINGTDYTFPDVDDSDWGQNVTDWAGAVSSFLLQRSGGTFTLGAAVDFGTSYGLKLKDLESKTTGASTDASAFLRLAKTDYISWRNNAGGANLTLEKNTSDLLEFATKELINEDATQTLTNKTLTAPVISTISNSGTLTLPTGAETLVGRNTTDTLTNKTIDFDSNTVSNIVVGNLKSGVLDTNLTSVSGSDDTLASAKAIKTYVDTQVGGSSLEFTGDNTTGTPTVDLDAQALVITGGTGLTSTASAQTLTMAIDATVATLTGSQALTNKTIDVDSNTVSNIQLTNLKSGVLDTDLSDGTSASDDTIASAKAIKTYVDAQVTAQDLDFRTDSDTGTPAVDLDSQNFTIAGGTGIGTVGANQTVTINIDSTVATLTGAQTLSSKTLTTPVIASLQQASGTNTLTMPAATDTLVARATTDTLTNKTLTGANIGTGKVTDYAIFDHQGSDPGATPDSNDVFLYAKENKIYTKDSTGSVTELGAGGGVGSIDTLFTLQAKTADAATSGSGNDAVFLGGGSLNNGNITLDTTAADLIGTDKVFKYDATGDSIRNYWYHEQSIYPGYAGKNMVLQLQYYTRNGADGESFRFVARDATMPILSVTSDGTNTITGTIDATVATAPVVGDKIIFKDSSNNIYYRYITAIVKNSGSDGKTSADNMTYTYSGSDVAATGKVVTGIMTDELDYLPANDITGNEAKIYKKQMLFPDNCTTFQFGFHCLDSDTDIELFYDDIALSANQFLQTSSVGETQTVQLNTYAGSYQTYTPYFTNTVVDTITSNYGTFTNESGGGAYTHFEANIRCEVTMSVWQRGNASGDNYVAIIKNDLSASDPSGSGLNNNRVAYGKGLDNDGAFCSARVVLNKGDTLRPAHASGGVYSGDEHKAGMLLTVTPEVNDVVLLNSQNEIFSDWVDGGTLTFDAITTAPTKPSGLSKDKIWYRRNGSNYQFKYEYQQTNQTGAAAGSGDYLLSLPAGLSFDLGVQSVYTTSEGYGAWLSSVGIGGGTVGWSDQPGYAMIVPYNATQFRVFIIRSSESSVWRSDYFPLTGFAADPNLSAALHFEAPIAGCNSTFNPVLSMPLVDFDTYENVYSARCTISGSTVTVVSQSPPNWLDASASTGAAASTIKTQPGIFTVAPTAVLTPTQYGPGGDEIAMVLADIAIDGSGVVTFTMAGGDIEGNIDVSSINFNIVAMRQGADYKNPPQATAAVIKPAVAIISNTQSSNTYQEGQFGGSNAWIDRVLNTIKGESWFIDSLSSNTFTLQAGMYKVSASAPAYYVNNHRIQLYDNTNSTTKIMGTTSYSASSYNGQDTAELSGVFTITSATAFKIKHINEYNYANNNALGNNSTAPGNAGESVFTSVTIEKLK